MPPPWNGTSLACAIVYLNASPTSPANLPDRLVRAAGFRNVVAHAYERLDMARVYRAATTGPANLFAFVGAIARLDPA
ncbi:MAG TPA: HepT-like ribonuclease domain-containing protein [Vicinamibacterales bacterium]|nr:HepT-like ribonuclease domain-containing protein [Vicinamibacterales bacterium]